MSADRLSEIRPEIKETIREVHISGLAIGMDPVQATKTPVKEFLVGRFGILHDKHYGETRIKTTGKRKGEEILNERQWSAVSDEEMAILSERLNGAEIPAGTIGENFRFSDIGGFSQLPRGTRLIFPTGAVLVIAGENLPCRKAGEALAEVNEEPSIASEFAKKAIGIRGVVGWVESPGRIMEENTVIVEIPVEPLAGTPGK